ncbi:GNAT family N-acetyltransferase [Microbacterium sp. Marseille-Q6965]|uniref:GNAT family N-acetyltransferase n=1 Tax=Microbacterium sp. Marseille-Q6965 TaxID=2965072 RepID=UPI0021B79DA9|nr:GNAT family N-acetyltransferase [Microbacterium sp. Marseille-Q6965]
MISETLTITPLHVPASLDAPDAADFRAMVRIGNDEWARAAGTRLLDEDELDVLTRWQSTTDYTNRAVVARRDGRIAAVAACSYDNATEQAAEVYVNLAEEFEDEELHDRMLAEAETLAADDGRTALQSYTIHPAAGSGDMLPSPTGSGRVPRDAFAERMLRNGYTLQQVERTSIFDLHGSFDEVDRLLEESLAAAGPSYRVVSWTGRAPEEYIDGYAAILGRLSTDAPSGDMVAEASEWDAERVRRREERHERAGRLLSVVLVIHEPTGQVAAHNDLGIGPDRTKPTEQYGTLVAPEHRGHRLGSIVKCVGLKRWREAVPESPCVITWNAEENRFMLDVNERVGFRPLAYAGAWEKRLDAAMSA